MNKLAFPKFFLLILIIPSITFVRISEDKALKNTIMTLLNYCKENSYEKAAKLIAYTGEDKSRELKTHFNAALKEELNQVKRICKKISALIGISSGYEFGNITSTKDNGMYIYKVELIFKSGEEKLITTFSFVKTDVGYLLINVN